MPIKILTLVLFNSIISDQLKHESDIYKLKEFYNKSSRQNIISDKDILTLNQEIKSFGKSIEAVQNSENNLMILINQMNEKSE